MLRIPIPRSVRSGTSSLTIAPSQAPLVGGGGLRAATDAQAIAKISRHKYLTPDNLAALTASESASGLVEFADANEANDPQVANRVIAPYYAARNAASWDRRGISGLRISNGTDATNDLDIAVGVSTSDGTAPRKIITTAMTKRLDAEWSIGSGGGLRGSGMDLIDSWWYLYHMYNEDENYGDFVASISSTVSGAPSGYDYTRRIGAFLRTGSTILAFVQAGDYFMWKTPRPIATATDPGTSAVTVAAGTTYVPIVADHSIIADAVCRIIDQTPAVATLGLVSSPDATDVDPATYFNHTIAAAGAGAPIASTVRHNIPTSDGTFRFRLSNSNSDIGVSFFTMGYWDKRGDV